MEHTALPLHIPLLRPHDIYDKFGHRIAEVFIEANAEFIVRACNNFYPMLEACRLALVALPHGEVKQQIEQALAKAEGRE